MSFLRRRYSGDGAYGPREPFEINKESLQARGLVCWLPISSGSVTTGLRDYSMLQHGVFASAGTSNRIYQPSIFGSIELDFLADSGVNDK